MILPHGTSANAFREALQATQQWRLPLRSRVWRGLSGEWSGAGTGSSLDFQDHRIYVPGDDPRHINWQAYARSGNYTMKLYREEVSPKIDLVLDVSESMFYDEEKAQRSLELWYFAYHSARQIGASVTLFALRGQILTPLLPEQFSHESWLDELLAAPFDGTPPAVQRVPWRANSLRVLISDLLFPGDPQPIVQALTQKHGIAMVYAPFTRQEESPDWSGHCEMLDVEQGNWQPHFISREVLTTYQNAYQQHRKLWLNAAQRHQVALCFLPSEKSFLEVLLQNALPQQAIEPI